MWRCICVITAVWRLEQEDGGFKTSLNYLGKLSLKTKQEREGERRERERLRKRRRKVHKWEDKFGER